MDDIKQRLKFDDIAVRSRCMQKLVHAVKKKCHGELLTSSSVQIPELTLIWETCIADSRGTSNLAVQGIIYLVSNHYLDVNYALNKLLSCLTSESNVYVIVKGISKLVLHQMKQLSESNKSICYSLHQRKHPLISVLQINANYMPLILENIANAISEDNLRGFQAMEPVICYILRNPAGKSNYSKSLIIEILIDIIRSDPKIAFYILRCIPSLQVENYEEVVEAADYILKTKKAFATFNCDERDRIYISELLLLASLSLSERSLTFGHDPTRLLEVAINISDSLLKYEYKSTYINLCLILVAMILKKAQGVIVEKYIKLAMVLTDFKDVSPTTAAFLASSVIQLLPEPSVISFSESPSSSLSQLLEKLEKYFFYTQKSKIPPKTSSGPMEGTSSDSNAWEPLRTENLIFIEAFTFSVESSLTCSKFALKLDDSSLDFKCNWLMSIKDNLSHSANGSGDLDVIYSLVAALFLAFPDDCQYLNVCLETFAVILLKNTYLSTKIFALLLYKLSLLEQPDSKFLILEFLPKSATHKYAIPPVLSILKMMSNNEELKAQAIQLMLQLWKRHDRCFFHLHKMLLENSKFTKDFGINEVLISQTAAIRKICHISPEKHGIEFLGTLSKVFNESNDDSSSPAACLALDGVISLCTSEITDLRSTWKMLGPRLSKDRRPAVACRMYKLLSLVPDLQVKSSEYDKFMTEIAGNIWKRLSTGSMCPETTSAAYKTLSKFPLDCYILKQLPPAAKCNLQLPISMKSTPFDMSKLPEDVLTYIPGYCYIDLLKSLEDNIVIEGYTEFLHSIIKQEVEELPRSVYNPQKYLKKRQNVNEALAAVPKFMCDLFGSRKAPTLQKNIAVGVLLSYEPPLLMGKDGEPIKSSLASQSRCYEQVLGALLNEVNIDATEWQRSILLPTAWGGFMERTFFSCEESRRAELELQRNLGHREFTTEEFNLNCKCAWLWVRDRLLNMVKTSVKNAPTSHANAVFAVAGLVNAIHKFRTNLDDATKALSDDNEGFTRHEIFATECTETILCAMMPNYQPKGKVHSWLLTHLSRPNSSTSYLIQGCACASLCHVTPVLTVGLVDEMPHIFQNLLRNLTHSSPVLSFYSGLAIGLLIRSLCDSGYADLGESQMQLLLKTAKDVSDVCYSENDPPSSAVISLTISMASLSHTACENFKDWISTTSNAFHEKLMEEEVKSMSFELLSICVSAMIISSAEGNCMPVESAINLASWFEEKQSELPQCSGISVSTGMLIEALGRFGHSYAVSELGQKLQKEWFNALTSEKKPTLHRIAALNGLCSLYSCGRGLLQAKPRESDPNASGLNDLLSLMFQILNAGRDTGLQNICSWEVGRLFSVHSFQQEADVSVPGSYSYLPEKSILKPLMKMILSSQSSGEEININPHHLLSGLMALGRPFPRPLPPVNWISILTPFLQQNESSTLANAALNIALHQANGSTYATNILSSYSCPPLFHTLPENSQTMLINNIPELSAVLPPHKLKLFLQTVISHTIKVEKNIQSIGCVTMKGVQDALVQTGLKQQAVNVLQDAFIVIFRHFKKSWSLTQEHLKYITETLSQLPEKKVESLLSVSRNSDDIAVLTLIVCYLVRNGKKKLLSLRCYIEEGKHSSQENKELICSALYQCFLAGHSDAKFEVNQPDKCISWLLETIGWINVLNDTKSQYQLMTVKEVFLFLTDVCLTTIVSRSGLECSYSFLPLHSLNHQTLLENLPLAITKLSMENGWNKVINKIIDWFLLLLQSPHLNENDKHYIKMSLCAVRRSDEFKKLEIWTNVIGHLY